MKKKKIYSFLATSLIAISTSMTFSASTVYAQSDSLGNSPADAIIDKIYRNLSPQEKRRIDQARANNAKCLAKAGISAVGAYATGGSASAASAFLTTLASCGW